MASLPDTSVEYWRNPRRALEDLRDALEKFEQAYHATRVETFWDDRIGTWRKLWYERWRFSQYGRENLTDMRVCKRLEFVFKCVVLASKREPELFGILGPGEFASDVVSWISEFRRGANGNESFDLGKYPLSGLADKLDLMEFEILTSKRFVNLGESDESRQGSMADDESDPTTMLSVGLLASSESGPAVPETEGQGSKTDDEPDLTTMPGEFDESGHAVPMGNSQKSGAQQSIIFVPTNEDVARVANLVASGTPVQTAAKKIAKNSMHSAGSLKSMYYAWKRKAKK